MPFDRIFRWTFASLLLLCSVLAQGQGVRWDLGSPGSAGAVTVGNGSGFPPLYALSGVQLNWCNHPANAVPCTNYATTYTSISLAQSCPINAQVVLQGSSTCQGTGDNFGNVGVWTASNTNCTATCYDYTLTVNGVSSGPYVWIAGGGGGSSSIQSPVGWQSIPPSLPYVILAPDPSGTCAYPASILTQGQISVCNSGNNSLWLNAGAGNSQLFTVRPPSTSFSNGAIPQWVAANGDFEILPLTFPGGTLPVAQIGDSLRFNVNGDGNWDAQSSGVAKVTSIYADANANNSYTSVGQTAGALQLSNSTNIVYPTATSGPGKLVSSAAAGSVNPVIGLKIGENGNNSLLPLNGWYRITAKLAIGSLSNARYFIGLGTWNTGSGLGNNSLTTFGSAGWAADSPNKTFIGFRYSSTTDTTYKAVTITAGTGQTTVDTGVTADTNVHVFEVFNNATNTSFQFAIDGTVRATITTNIPPVLSSSDALGTLFYTGDNKNTATSISATIFELDYSQR